MPPTATPIRMVIAGTSKEVSRWPSPAASAPHGCPLRAAPWRQAERFPRRGAADGWCAAETRRRLPVPASAEPPPRAVRLARSTARRPARLPMASRTMPSAGISATPFSSSVPSTRLNRAARISFVRPPTIGRRSSTRSTTSRTGSCRSAKRATTRTHHEAAQQHQAVRLRRNRRRRSGTAWRPAARPRSARTSARIAAAPRSAAASTAPNMASSRTAGRSAPTSRWTPKPAAGPADRRCAPGSGRDCRPPRRPAPARHAWRGSWPDSAPWRWTAGCRRAPRRAAPVIVGLTAGGRGLLHVAQARGPGPARPPASSPVRGSGPPRPACAGPAGAEVQMQQPGPAARPVRPVRRAPACCPGVCSRAITSSAVAASMTPAQPFARRRRSRCSGKPSWFGPDTAGDLLDRRLARQGGGEAGVEHRLHPAATAARSIVL